MQKQHPLRPAIVFDFGGVLIDWDPRYLYRKIFNGDDQAVEQFLKEVHFFEWNQQQDAGRPFSEAVAEACLRYPDRCDLIQAYNERYIESISGPIWPTVEILRELKGAGYPLYGLSNWPEEKFPPVRDRFGFFSWFDDIIISGEVKLAKPDPAIFGFLLQRIGLNAWDCLYIDDAAHNIEVAQALKFQTIYYKTPEQLRVELRKSGITIPEIQPGSYRPDPALDNHR